MSGFEIFEMYLKLLAFLLLFSCGCMAIIEERVIEWNSKNTIFRDIDPTIEVKVGEVLRLVCPDNSNKPEHEKEYLTIYEVGELAFEECLVETGSKEMLRCSPELEKDKEMRSAAQLIRTLNPMPNGREFQAGQTYYYITTSSGRPDRIDQHRRGLCETSNMRLRMKVTPPKPNKLSEIMPTPEARREIGVQETIKNLNNNESEDEDSLNDSDVKLATRDLEKKEPSTYSPKFRRPTEFNEAGVRDQQFREVARMASEGKTGTFENMKPTEEALKNGNPWDPIDVQYVTNLMENGYRRANDDQLTYQRETDYEIHEDNSVRSLEYSSSSYQSTSIFLLFIPIIILAA